MAKWIKIGDLENYMRIYWLNVYLRC